LVTQFKDHFSSLAEQYAQARPGYPPALFEYLASLCAERGSCWDCACGSGQASNALAEYFGRVIATDASAKQVAAAEPHPHVEYRVAAAEASGLGSRSMDLVTVAQALHWFRFDEFYAEAKRVLKPGGVLAVWSYGIQHVADEPRIDAEVQRFYSDVIAAYWPAERKHVENGYGNLPFPFDELEPPRLAMQERWSLERLIAYFRSWSATGRYVKEMGEDPVAALREQMLPLWGNPETLRLIEWPLAIRVGRVSAMRTTQQTARALRR
jgi:SAM-dependent methyltransferase